ncbi:DMT family transporter [Pasteurella atlantica]|uniref:DMT family transporter n=1 Tax=Pasteurellaceae TaxID=712 RepID=UPI00276141BF|nr:DMT family transporter [Pasteurella atlantica]MDP8100001.1 DMT family transporter [Pasteurella atlantica]MDP8107846.1 DMT family transporter [Pasteurella atlantica]MDP8115868.1 DMT family transporter [Pasteurella atlantica]
MQELTYIKKQQRGLIEMLLAMVICGTIGLTVVLSGEEPSNLIFFRCLFGSLVLGFICFYKGLFQSTTYTKVFWVSSLIGGIALQLNWYLLFSAYNNASIGVATTVYNTQPFMMVFICALLFKEKITKSILFWLLVSFIGLYLISSTKVGVIETYDVYIVGILQALGTATLYAVASISAKYLVGFSPILIAFFQMALGILVFFPFAKFEIFSTSNFQEITATITLGVVHTGLMYILLYGAIQKLEAYKVASLSFLYPVLALLIDRFYFDVHLVVVQVVGILLIFLGAAGINLRGFIDTFLKDQSKSRS